MMSGMGAVDAFKRFVQNRSFMRAGKKFYEASENYTVKNPKTSNKYKNRPSMMHTRMMKRRSGENIKSWVIVIFTILLLLFIAFNWFRTLWNINTPWD